MEKKEEKYSENITKYIYNKKSQLFACVRDYFIVCFYNKYILNKPKYKRKREMTDNTNKCGCWKKKRKKFRNFVSFSTINVR